jgi:hypothetical protein
MLSNFLIISKLYYLFVHVIPVLVAAITLANILNEFGIINKISWIIKPIIKLANLSPESGLAVITYVASGNAASAMLASFYEQKTISERETIVASFVGSFFSFLNHVLVYFIPVVIPLLGLKAGILYISARMVISACVTLTAIVSGHFLLKNKFNKKIKNREKIENVKNNINKKEMVRTGIKKSINVLKKILPRLILVYTITSILIEYRVFKPFENFRILNLPSQASAIVAAGVADTTAGFAAAGSLLSSNVITPVQAVSALLLTSIVSMSVIFVRHSLPGRIAYFGVKLGFKIAIISSLLNIVYTALVLAFLLH